jgi:hypothetical protein
MMMIGLSALMGIDAMENGMAGSAVLHMEAVFAAPKITDSCAKQVPVEVTFIQDICHQIQEKSTAVFMIVLCMEDGEHAHTQHWLHLSPTQQISRQRPSAHSTLASLEF